MDLEEFDSENKRSGMTVLERLDALEAHLGPGSVFPESLLQDLDEMRFESDDLEGSE